MNGFCARQASENMRVGMADHESRRSEAEDDELSDIAKYCSAFVEFCADADTVNANATLLHLSTFFEEEIGDISSENAGISEMCEMLDRTRILTVINEVLESNNLVKDRCIEFLAVLSTGDDAFCEEIVKAVNPLVLLGFAVNGCENAVKVFVNCLTQIMATDIDLHSVIEALFRVIGDNAELAVRAVYSLVQDVDTFGDSFRDLFGIISARFNEQTNRVCMLSIVAIVKARSDLAEEICGSDVIKWIVSQQDGLHESVFEMLTLFDALISQSRTFYRSIKWRNVINVFFDGGVDMSVIAGRVIDSAVPEVVESLGDLNVFVSRLVSLLCSCTFAQKRVTLCLLASLCGHAPSVAVCLSENVEFCGAMVGMIESGDPCGQRAAVKFLERIVECAERQPTTFDRVFHRLADAGLCEMLDQIHGTERVVQMLSLCESGQEDEM